MKKNPRTVTRRIGNEALLLPLRPVEQGLWAYELNETASMVWSELDRTGSVPALAARLCEEFELSPEDALRDVEELVAELRSLGAIE